MPRKKATSKKVSGGNKAKKITPYMRAKNAFNKAAKDYKDGKITLAELNKKQKAFAEVQCKLG